jgi:hypothetical protein
MRGFSEWAERFRKVVLSTVRERHELLIRYSHDLWNELERTGDGIVSKILEVCDEVSKTLCAAPITSSPIQLHLICEPEMLALPLDLALRPGSGVSHLCDRLPIIWRLQSSKGPNETDEVRLSNTTDYRRFVAAYSCCVTVNVDGVRFNGIEEAEGSTLSIAQTLGLERSHTIHVQDANALRQGLGLDGTVFDSGYIVTHGIHRQPAQHSALVVGPLPNTEADGHFVTPTHLVPSLQHRGLRFLYVNSCELAAQDTNLASAISYFGSFAEGLLTSGVCQETVSNRWSVTFGWANRLALEFYKRRARTVQGRSAALFAARRHVRSELHHQPDGRQYDPTWLAPIHIWNIC